MTIVERIARVMAGYRLSSNAGGQHESAGAVVDLDWPNYREEAMAILNSLREPSPAMVESGMAGDWRALVEAEISMAAQVL